MQVDLPVHKPAGHEEFLNAVDRFLFYHQPVIHHLQHFDDAVAADNPFAHPRVKTVPVQVIHAVNIQLAAHQPVQCALRMLVSEDADTQRERPIQLFVQPVHDQSAQFFMANTVHQAMLQRMAERPVPNVMQQDRDRCTQGFFFRNGMTLAPQHLDGLAHQVHGT